MKRFRLNMDRDLFQKTNALWNSLQLNHPWSVGMVANLIRQREFTNGIEWVDYYYQSGVERLGRIDGLSAIEKLIVNGRFKPVKKTSIKVLATNFDFGRTRGELIEKAMALQKAMANVEGVDMSSEDSLKAVQYRVLAETWNGVYLRELKVTQNIKERYPELTFSPASGFEDFQYAIDYQLFMGDKKICALQIKPPSYLSNASYVVTARQYNERKFKAYGRDTGLKVYVLIGHEDGGIVEDETWLAFNACISDFLNLR